MAGNHAHEQLRFPGNGTTCQADDDRGTDFGRCGEPAHTIVNYHGHDRPVCRDHYERMPADYWQQNQRPGGL